MNFLVFLFCVIYVLILLNTLEVVEAFAINTNYSTL